jgi:AhpD family alkylhydroperoxidase
VLPKDGATVRVDLIWLNALLQLEVAMSTDIRSFYRDWTGRMSHAKGSAQGAAKGFGGLYQSVMRSGALSAREKELVALGIGLALRCEPCIYTHAESALKAGATREQIMEAAGVAVMMQGGPTYTYLPNLVEALDVLESDDPARRAEPQAHQLG